MRNVLFVCSQNRLRSPTAQQIFSTCTAIQCLSAGLDYDAVTAVTLDLIDWADIIFVMEKAHRNKLTRKFKAQLLNKQLICLNIPDEYEFMDAELVQLLKLKVSRFLPINSAN
jgi:predicted protein tyrosine phosphatase